MAQTDSMAGTVAAYFDSRTDAARAVEALKSAGFSSAHLGVAHYGDAETESKATTEGAKDAGEPGMWGKIKHMFEGGAEPCADEQATGDLATREITTDPTGSFGNVEGEDLHRNLNGLNVPADRSRYFGHKLNSSDAGAVVTVNAGARYDEAASILTRLGGDVGEGAEGF